MSKKPNPITKEVYSSAIGWIAETDTIHESTVVALKFSPAVCLLSHLTGRTPTNVAEDVIHRRKDV